MFPEKHAPISRFNSFLFGLTLPWTALRLILSHPRLIILSIIPVTVTATLYILFIWKIRALLFGIVSAYLIAHGIQTTGWAMTLFQWTLQVFLMILGALTFAWGATLVSIPVNDFLAEATEPLATPPLPKTKSFGFSWRVRLIAIDAAKTLAAIGMGLVLLIFSWIPVINFFSWSFSFLLVCFQFISFPQSRRGQGIREGIRFISKHLYSSLGFGAAVAFLLAIPFVSFFFLPLAVVGGTLLVARGTPHPEHLRLR